MNKNKPRLQLADILRHGFSDYLAKYGPLPDEHYKVVNAITSCKTSALGGHVYRCDECGHEHIAYNSCRNRHCPSCQVKARIKWVEARMKELLPVPYFHVVFTIPQQLNPFALRNKKAMYSILFKAASETLKELASNPKWIHAETGFMSVLHTWGQTLIDHPHLHCIVPGGGLVKNGKKWKHCRKDFLFPFEVMRKLFRGKFMAFFKKAVLAGEIRLFGSLQHYSDKGKYRRLIDKLYRIKWNVYAKRPFAGPEAVIKYLGGYTHRIAISNHRLEKMENGKVSFRYKDHTDNGKTKSMTLETTEFIRRFLMHVLPTAFTRIRYFGFMANRKRKEKLLLCRNLLTNRMDDNTQDQGEAREWHEIVCDLIGRDPFLCPMCEKGRLKPYKEIPKPLRVSAIRMAA